MTHTREYNEEVVQCCRVSWLRAHPRHAEILRRAGDNGHPRLERLMLEHRDAFVKNVYDDEYEMWRDDQEERKNPYAYRGICPSDFA